MNRRFLGRYNDLVTRHAVYATDSAIEVDERDLFAIVRKRVFFEDVLLITLHERPGIFVIFISLGFAALLGLFGIIAGGTGGAATTFVAMLFFINGALRIRVKESIITIFGQRSRARIRFTLRQEHAHRLYDDLCAQVRRVQSAMAPPVEEDRNVEQPVVDPGIPEAHDVEDITL